MGLLDHLEELRVRLLRSVLVFFVAFLVCWGQAERIYLFLEQPIRPLLPEGTKLAFLGITDPADTVPVLIGLDACGFPPLQKNMAAQVPL